MYIQFECMAKEQGRKFDICYEGFGGCNTMCVGSR